MQDIHEILSKTLSLSSRKLIGSFVTDVTESYELLLTSAGDPIIVRTKELERLSAGGKPRIIGANLKTRRLLRVSLRNLSTLKGYLETNDHVSLRAALKLIQDFITKRESVDPPFYGALSDSISNESRFSTVPYRYGRPKLKWSALSNFDQRVIFWRGTTYSSISRRENRAADRLNDDDIDLINIWANDYEQTLTRSGLNSEYLGSPSRFKRYIYARMAEKFVVEFYEKQLGRKASDVSILQLGGTDPRWKTHDIETDTLIDVKNATVFSRYRRRHNYVDKFKTVDEMDVAIAGVLSDPNGPQYEKGIRQTLLGLVTRRDVMDAMDAVNGLPDRLFPVTAHFDTGYIPAWAFELDEYAPDYEVLYQWAVILARKPETIMALAIACGRHQECDVYPALSQSQRELVDRFALAVSKSSYRKLTIALFSISEFINSVAQGKDGAAVIRFVRRMISIEDFTDWPRTVTVPYSGLLNSGLLRGTQQLKIGDEYEIYIDCPGGDAGGLYDPTNSLKDLLSMLEECGERIASSGIIFRHFDAPSPYMLVGKTDRGKKLTIYTHCGGRSKSSFRCDNFPLSIGKHPNCHTCGRLICDECGFCSERCVATSGNTEAEF